MLWLIWLQYENASALQMSVKYHTLTEYRREATTPAVVFRAVSVSSSGQLSPPSSLSPTHLHHFPLYQCTPAPIGYSIPPSEAGSALVT
ncbi:hypothetical protein EVAR_40040_1 [Eumeta japonica]|uniref:Uncharacterized protein n=1 Tax=Eumeta variegata TaxID=151549 RepID=A0A4C1WBW1_EUMVA|nr:hypothetical protein EVAR_40040_1 [Eumeta japonica]